MSYPWKTIELHTRARVEVQDITAHVAEVCQTAGSADGLVFVTTEHTTAAVCLNEAEPGLLRDLEGWLERIAPAASSYAHNTIDDNADAHLRAILLGHNVCVPLTSGSPGLGRWQRILFVELDGPRSRRVRVKVMVG